MVAKVKKAERIEPNHLLGIDSPMVIWRTDLDTLGLTKSSGGGGTPPGGGGTSSSTGSETTGGGEEPPPADLHYIALCDAVVHSADVAGAVEDGRWFGSLQSDFSAAQAEAQAHEDGAAYVTMYVDALLVGPVVHA